MMTIFANMMINNQSRLQHLQDSCRSFKNVSDNWLINIRGTLREEALEFLRQELGDKITEFELLDENRGWFVNSLDMLKEAKHDYVLVWNEDHLNIAPEYVYSNILKEMRENDSDYLLYSWWLGGKARKQFEVEGLKNGILIDTVLLTKDAWKKQLKKGYDDYLVSMAGVFKKEFLVNIFKKERKKLPRLITTNLFRAMILFDKVGIKFNHRKLYDLINRFLFGKLTKYPVGPFDMERSPYRFDVLPLKIALPKRELFACIDDDLGQEGYSLISRGVLNIK